METDPLGRGFDSRGPQKSTSPGKNARGRLLTTLKKYFPLRQNDGIAHGYGYHRLLHIKVFSCSQKVAGSMPGGAWFSNLENSYLDKDET